MQYYDDVAQAFAGQHGGARECSDLLMSLLAAEGDVAALHESPGRFEISQQSWKLMDGVSDYHPACRHILHGLFEGLAAGCGRHISVDLATSSGGRPPFTWSIAS